MEDDYILVSKADLSCQDQVATSEKPHSTKPVALSDVVLVSKPPTGELASAAGTAAPIGERSSESDVEGDAREAGCPPVGGLCDSEDDCEDQAEVWDADASDLDAAGRVARRKEVPRKSSLDAAFVIGLVVLLISTTKIVVQLVAGPIGPVPGIHRVMAPVAARTSLHDHSLGACHNIGDAQDRAPALLTEALQRVQEQPHQQEPDHLRVLPAHIMQEGGKQNVAEPPRAVSIPRSPKLPGQERGSLQALSITRHWPVNSGQWVDVDAFPFLGPSDVVGHVPEWAKQLVPWRTSQAGMNLSCRANHMGTAVTLWEQATSVTLWERLNRVASSGKRVFKPSSALVLLPSTALALCQVS